MIADVKRKLLHGSAFCLALLTAGGHAAAQIPDAVSQEAPAQDGQNEGGLQEIIVTAQTRAQKLQEVPISVVAVQGTDLATKAVIRPIDLQIAAPGFTATETAFATQFFIRGIGSGLNAGFEQSVGLYVDGVHLPRSLQTRIPFLDVDRVEVLRGPQSILLGKNAIAGALNVTTAKPTQDFFGRLTSSYEFNANELGLEGAVSGPITDTIRVRVAGKYRSSDGYIRNLTLNRLEPARDEAAIRVTADIDVTQDLQLSFKSEYNQFNTDGKAMEIYGEEPAKAGPFAGLTYAQVLVNVFHLDPTLLDNRIDGRRTSDGEKSRAHATANVLTLNWQTGGYTLRSTTAYTTALADDDAINPDLLGARIITGHIHDKYTQFSQELRLISPKFDSFDFIAGAYYANGLQRYRQAVGFPSDSTFVTIVNARQPGAGTLVANTWINRRVRVEADTFSAFGQLNWRPISDVTVQFGGRLSYSKIQGRKILTVESIGGGALPAAQVNAPLVYAQVLAASSSNLAGLGAAGNAMIGRLGEFPVAGTRRETRFTPDVKILYRPTPQVMLYAGYARGQKSGGFDFAANNRLTYPTARDAFEFDDEKAQNFEVGSKMSLLGGRAELNLAAYYTKLTNLQISIFDGRLGFNVGNAASARAQGIEANGRMQLGRHFTLSTGVNYTDFKYLRFPNGQCYFGQTPTVDGNGDGVPEFCDYKGKSSQLTSKVTANASLTSVFPIFDGYQIGTTTEVFYASAYDAAANYDPAGRQAKYALLNMRVGVGPENGSWELAFVGRNLTDKQVFQFVGDTAIAATVAQAKSNYAILSQGRTLAIQLNAKF